MKSPYKISDKTMALLKRKASIRFLDAKARFSEIPFDEVNVMRAAKTLYSGLNRDNKRAFIELAERVYEEAEPEEKKKPDIEWLLLILEACNPITKYSYNAEVLRKRDRLAEAISSESGKTNSDTEIQKAFRYWTDMTAQYCDIVTDEATLKAYVDSGIEKVKWVTQEDERVCPICNERDGNIYPIDKVPPKPHWRCRCYLSPVQN